MALLQLHSCRDFLRICKSLLAHYTPMYLTGLNFSYSATSSPCRVITNSSKFFNRPKSFPPLLNKQLDPSNNSNSLYLLDFPNPVLPLLNKQSSSSFRQLQLLTPLRHFKTLSSSSQQAIRSLLPTIPPHTAAFIQLRPLLRQPTSPTSTLLP